MIKLMALTVLVALGVSLAAPSARADERTDQSDPSMQAESATREKDRAQEDASLREERLIARIPFAFDEDAVSLAARVQIGKLGPILVDAIRSGATITLHGHSDALGSEAYNLDISRRRAMRIKQYLVDEWNIKPEHIRVRAWGAQLPRDGYQPTAAINRRVDIVLVDVTPLSRLHDDGVVHAGRHHTQQLREIRCEHHHGFLDLDDFGFATTRPVRTRTPYSYDCRTSQE